MVFLCDFISVFEITITTCHLQCMPNRLVL